MSLSMFLSDGYTATKTLPGEPGLYPEVTVSYRPALARARAEFGTAMAGGVDKVHEFENRLIVRQRVTLNGEPVTAEQAPRLVPNLRKQVIDLVLGYTGEDEKADVGNSSGG